MVKETKFFRKQAAKAERISSSASRRTASLAGFFDLSHVFDGPLRYGEL
jgi:hypothetical protein